MRKMDVNKEPEKIPDGVLLEVHEQEDDSISGDKPDTSLISFTDEDASGSSISSLSTDKTDFYDDDTDVCKLVSKLKEVQLSDIQSHASGDDGSVEAGLKESQPDVSAGSSKQYIGGARPKESNTSISTIQDIESHASGDDGSLEAGVKESIKESQPDVSAGSSKQYIGSARPKESNTSISTKQDIESHASGGDGSLEAGLKESIKESQPDVSAGSSKQYIGGARPKESNTSISTIQDIESHASGGDGSLEAGLKESIKESQPDVSAGSSKQYIGGARPKESNTSISTIQGQEDVPKKYYAVSFPTADSVVEDNPLIYEHKTDAMKAIRLFPGARFREFSSRQEAYEYAIVPYQSEAALSFRVEGKKFFKSMNSREMAELRKIIKSGNVTMFLNRVWTNPRCLISHCDGPTVMEEETRYNALHIAARSGQTGMFLSILYVIQDSQFLSTLYPEDQPSMTEVRIKRLVDMYLNMPDRALSETPLHIACKFGYESIVCIILSYSQCNIQLKNRNGYCAKDIVCQHHKCYSHKERMLAVFEDLFYVPILRDDAHNFVGQPCNASTVIVATTSYAKKEESSATYWAFAGPASLSEARRFYTLLKTKKFIGEKVVPKSSFDSKAETWLEICLADPKKGLERAGRRLSKDFSIGWFEFWSILDGWFDMSSEEGLECLDNHLKKQEDQFNGEEEEPPAFTDVIMKFLEKFIQKIPGLAVQKNSLFHFHQLQSLVEHMDCFIKYTFSNETELENIHQEIGHLLYLKLTDDNRSNIENFQTLKFFLLTELICAGSLEKFKWQMFVCILRFACYFQSSGTMFGKEPLCTCHYTKSDNCFTYSSRSCYYAVVSLRQELTNDLVQKFEPSLETSEKKSNEVQYMMFQVLHGRLHLNFKTSREDWFFVETESNPFLNLDPFAAKFHAFQRFFIVTIDRFIFVFRSLMLKYEENVPFKDIKSFIDVFRKTMEYWKPICEVNYKQEYKLLFLHDAIASCLAFKMLTVPSKVVSKWKSYFGNNAFIYDNFDLIKYGVTSTREWMHLLCIIKLLCHILDDDDYLPLCTCTFETDRTQEFELASDCMELVTHLKKLYRFSYHFFNVPYPTSVSEEDEYLTPPDSSTDATHEVFVQGEVMSDADIDMFRAITDSVLPITKNRYPHIFKWKNLMESRMGLILQAEDTHADPQ